MDSHERKKVAPIVITIIIVLYYVLYFVLLMAMMPFEFKLIFGIIPASLGAVAIYVCMQRIKEIDEGEEDDISKY